jgi:hypothetical protein
MSDSISGETRLAPTLSARRARLLAAAEIALVFAVFFIQAAWPVPDVNEPYYLGKAKHFWNPDWCPEDFFCNTADAHHVFYWTFGWLTLWLPLPAVAWCGRLLGWALLAWSWRRLSVAVVSLPLYSVLTAALFVTLNSRCHMAGEWVVGGVEAKVFAYALVFLALAALVKNRWSLVWPLLGGASAVHVLVGGWSAVAAGLAWLILKHDKPSLRRMAGPLALGLALSLAGLLPALAINRGVDQEIVDAANWIHVFQRLPHHLLPERFGTFFIARYALLFAFWLLLCVTVPADDRLRRLRAFVAGTLAIALAGVGISLLATYNDIVAAQFLRFYWFRLSDVFLPVGVSFAVAAAIVRARERRPAWGGALLAAAMLLAGAHLSQVVWSRQFDMRPRADDKISRLDDWRKICRWISENTPADAVFLVPRDAQTFRWYSNRAEVVSHKDIPQDAPGIVEWSRRMEIYRADVARAEPGSSRSLAEMSPQRLEYWGAKYKADYVITTAQPPVALERIGPRDNAYAVYRLPRPVGTGTKPKSKIEPHVEASP